MTRRVVDKQTCTLRQPRLESLPETRDRVPKRRVKPHIDRRIAIPADPDDDVMANMSFGGWTHRQLGV